MLAHNCAYGGDGTCVHWSGEEVTDGDGFVEYLRGPVRERLFDLQGRVDFEGDMRALVTSDMGDSTLRALLSSDPPREPWEVGEVIAEAVLADEGVRWPWNMERDKRTPKASLPGADLVGFVGDGNEVRLALGEVKTSYESAAPPQVMYGRSGMVHQLDGLATRIDIHACLFKWLHPRCLGTPLWPAYQAAAKRYLQSGGREIVLFGLLMRDTHPNELDLKSRAEQLDSSVSPPTTVRLAAWYLPRQIPEWVSLVGGPE